MADYGINTCSVGIMAFNEAENIGLLIKDILGQKMREFSILEIVIVASGSTDSTQDIVMGVQKEDGRVKLLVQEERHGKASAINFFLKQAKGDFIVLAGADIRVSENVLEMVLSPLLKNDVGMTGARPVPVNRTDTFMGYGAHFLWQLHHQLSINKPKLGELVAFKNYIGEIPAQSAADEASIEALFYQRGQALKYVPEALVYNRGPETIREFLSQRERIFIGHLWVREKLHYSVSSLDNWLIARLIMKNIDFRPKYFVWMMGLISLEAFARLKGALGFLIAKKNPYIWKRVDTSKYLVDIQKP